MTSGIIITIIFGISLIFALARYMDMPDWNTFFIIIFLTAVFFFGIYRIDIAEKGEQPAKIELTQEVQ